VSSSPLLRPVSDRPGTIVRNGAIEWASDAEEGVVELQRLAKRGIGSAGRESRSPRKLRGFGKGFVPNRSNRRVIFGHRSWHTINIG